MVHDRTGSSGQVRGRWRGASFPAGTGPAQGTARRRGGAIARGDLGRRHPGSRGSCLPAVPARGHKLRAHPRIGIVWRRNGARENHPSDRGDKRGRIAAKDPGYLPGFVEAELAPRDEQMAGAQDAHWHRRGVIVPTGPNPHHDSKLRHRAKARSEAPRNQVGPGHHRRNALP